MVVDIIFIIPEVLVLIAYSFQTMLALRLVSILASTGYIVGASIAGIQSPGMKPLIFFSALTILINLIQIIRILIARIPVLLPQELQSIYTQSFARMTTKQFKHIFSLAKQVQYPIGEVLIRDNQVVNDLKYILHGAVEIERNGKIVNVLKRVFFVGEMSFITHANARGTVTAITDPVSCLVWDKSLLSQFKEKNPETFEKFYAVIIYNLVQKFD